MSHSHDVPLPGCRIRYLVSGDIVEFEMRCLVPGGLKLLLTGVLFNPRKLGRLTAIR
jgi:hypothetical protein